VEFTGAVFRRAAEIRASGNFKTPGALHLAAAVEGGCTAFLTNDTHLLASSVSRLKSFDQPDRRALTSLGRANFLVPGRKAPTFCTDPKTPTSAGLG
jgi:hypothetical protein